MNQDLIEKLFSEIMTKGLGLDLSDPNLRETPKRVSKMYCKELFSTMGKEFDGFKSFPDDSKDNQIVMLDNIDFTSTCSHHFLPFIGLAWILYIPKGRLIGASKCARLIHHYARRPQIQENLCREVLDAFTKELEPQGAMIVMRAAHGCMQARGVRQSGRAGMTTSAIDGIFHEQAVKMEALQLIELSQRG